MTARDRGISVLNNSLEWDKFVRLILTYSAPDSCLTYTKTWQNEKIEKKPTVFLLVDYFSNRLLIDYRLVGGNLS